MELEEFVYVRELTVEKLLEMVKNGKKYGLNEKSKIYLAFKNNNTSEKFIDYSYKKVTKTKKPSEK